LWTTLLVAWEEEVARANSSCEELALGELDDKRSEHVLNFSVVEAAADAGQTLGSLVSNNCLVLLGKFLEQRKEHSLVIDELEDYSKFFSNGKENLVIFSLDQLYFQILD